MITTLVLITSVARRCVVWREMGQFQDKDMARHYAASIYGDHQGVKVKELATGYIVLSWKRRP